MMMHLLRRAIRAGRTLRSERRGSVLIEVAFSMPILLILFSGGFEISRYALLEMKVSRTAMTIADLVSQNPETVSETEVEGFLEAIPHIGKPFTMDDTNTQVIVTAVRADDTDTPKVCWQMSRMADLGETSAIGAHNATATLPNDITMKEGDTAIIAEVFYDYTPTVFEGFVDPHILYNVSIYRPRLAKLDNLLPSNITCS